MSPATVVVAVGASGRALVPTIRAAAAAGVDQIVVAGAQVERIRQLVEASGVPAEVVDGGSTLATQRNAGVALARRDTVIIADAGTLFVQSWVDGAAAVCARGHVAHPELAVAYGALVAIWPQRVDPETTRRLLPVLNPIAAPFAAPRAVLVDIPFPDVDDAIVDAAWQAAALRAGTIHEVAPSTAVLIRTYSATPPWVRDPGVVVPGLAAATVPAGSRTRRPRSASRMLRLASGAARAVLRPWAVGARRVIRRLTASRAVPGWLLTQLELLHRFEPFVPYPTGTVGDRFVRWGDPWPASIVSVADRYAELRAALPARADYAFFAPWLVMGGGDNVLVRYTEAIARLDPTAQIVLLTTERVRSTRLRELPDNAVAVELMDRFDIVGERSTLVDRVLPQLLADLQPHTIHAFNSTLAFDVIERHPTSLDASVFLSSFAVDRAASGQQTSALFHRTPDFLDAVDGVLVDSARFVDVMAGEYGFDRSLFTVQRHVIDGMPAVSRDPERRFTAEVPLRVLWVGRFDLPKRLDVLADVAEAVSAAGLPVAFEFYGEEVMGDPSLPRTLARLAAAGAVRHPPFAGFASLPLDRLDAYIMTSEWEGIPNSMLEAMSAGLPVIAPDVGGIGGVLDDRTGFLVGRFDDIQAYLTALQQLVGDYGNGLARAERARAVIEQEFSRQAFDAGLERVPGYLRGPAVG